MARSSMPNSLTNGVIVYRGPSMLDGQPIVAIATGLKEKSDNPKTGDMVQIFIMTDNITPSDALHVDSDASVCGNCPLRGVIENGRNKRRACYVNVFMSPQNVFKTYDRGRYPVATNLAETFSGKIVRLGAYGDPTAVPLSVWQEVLTNAKAHTGYTHQWHRFPEFSSIVMASVENKADRLMARMLGFRTFRVSKNNPKGEKDKNEVVCPASEEMGNKTNCENCRACGGTSAKANCDIVIKIHGPKHKQKHFMELLHAD